MVVPPLHVDAPQGAAAERSGQNSAYGATAALTLMTHPRGIPPRPRGRIALLLASTAAYAAMTAATVAQDLSIREYKPKSTLVVPAHPVPRAKYPVIDVHSHHWQLTSESYAQVVRDMDALNLRVLVNRAAARVRD